MLKNRIIKNKAERLIQARYYLDYMIVIRRSVLVGALVLFSLNAVIYGRDVSVYVLTALYESKTFYWVVSAFFFLLYIVPTFCRCYAYYEY